MFRRTGTAEKAVVKRLPAVDPVAPKDRTDEFQSLRRGSGARQSPGGTSDLWHLLCEEYLRKGRDKTVLSPKGANQAVRECARCSSAFGGLFSATRGQQQCPLCLELYCSECLSRQIPLDQPSVERMARAGLEEEAKKTMISICVPCDTLLVQFLREKRIRHQATTSKDRVPMAQVYAISCEIVEQITALLGELRKRMPGVLDQAMPVTLRDAKELNVLLKRLASFFENYSLAMQQMAKVPCDSRTAKMVLAHVKAKMAAFYSRHYSEFRLLEKQALSSFKSSSFQERLRKTEIAAAQSRPLTAQEVEEMQRRAEETRRRIDEQTLQISSIEPAVMGLDGDSIIVTGKNFHAKTVVSIDDSPCESTTINPTVIVAVAPPGPEGQRSIKVLNPDGAEFVLYNCLFYSALINSLPPDTPLQPLSPPPSSSTPSISSTSFSSSSSSSSSSSRSILNPNPSGAPVDPPLDEFDDEKPPEIRTINPVVSPLTGMVMEVTGVGFLPSSSAIIDDFRIHAHEISFSKLPSGFCSLRFRTPCLPPGPKTVRITNPNGRYVEFRDILMYMSEVPNELFSISSSTPPTTGPSSSSSFPSSGSSATAPPPRRQLMTEPTSDFLVGAGVEQPRGSFAPRPRRVWGK